MNFKNTMTN